MFDRLVLASWLMVGTGTLAAAAPRSRVPVVSDSIVSRLGPVHSAAALDFTGFDLRRFTKKLPPELACVGEFLGSVKLVVIAHTDRWQGTITGIPEEPTRACLDKVLPQLGAKLAARPGGGYALAFPHQLVIVAWQGTTVVVTEGDGPAPTGDPPPEILGPLSQVPRDVRGWLVASADQESKRKSALGWVEARADRLVLTFTMDGTEPGTARSAIEAFVGGMKDQAEKNGFKLEDRWFVITSAKTATTLVATIPYSVLPK